MNLYIGLMSGTSMDGIDVAIVDVEQDRLIEAETIPYSPDLKEEIQILIKRNASSPAYLAQLDTQIGLAFGEAVNALLSKSMLSRQDIVAIGSHGQTICHDASATIPYSLQLGCGHAIAQVTGLPVVADFRRRDLLVGGQGAPLAPLYHQAVFAEANKRIGIVNIGGIANITILDGLHQCKGWDTGPGNCLLDAWIQDQLGLPYDADGDWARTGRADKALVESLLDDPFLAQQPPKSLDKAYYNLDKLRHKITRPLAPESIQQSLIWVTGVPIAEAARQAKVEELLICGGGAHNSLLLETLQALLPTIPVMSTEARGISADFIEAMLFAWLASKRMAGESLNLGPITGSRMAIPLGCIYPA